MNIKQSNFNFGGKKGPYEVRCPKCNSDAVYKYGKTYYDKQKFLCLMCNSQFVLHRKSLRLKHKRPTCPDCGRPMHVYMRQKGLIRFRCSGYPECKTYFVIREEED